MPIKGVLKYAAVSLTTLVLLVSLYLGTKWGVGFFSQELNPEIQHDSPEDSLRVSSPPCGIWDPVSKLDFAMLPSGSFLTALEVLLPDNIWAVGSSTNQLDYTQTAITQIAHWNGDVWRVIDHPSLQGELYDIAANSANDIWAVGYGNQSALILHYDGAAWKPVSVPVPQSTKSVLYAVTARSRDDVWAVGSWGYNENKSLVMHWDGTTWSLVPGMDPGTKRNVLKDVAAITATNVWAVGYQDSTTGNYAGGLGGGVKPLIEQWDGARWSVISAPDVLLTGDRNEGGSLHSISALTDKNIWIAGYSQLYDSSRTLVMHWDGDDWSVVATPSLSSEANYLRTVSAVSTDSVWVVGSYGAASSSSNVALLLHWNGTNWAIVPSPEPLRQSKLLAAKGIGEDNLWVIGMGHSGERPVWARFQRSECVSFTSARYDK